MNIYKYKRPTLYRNSTPYSVMANLVKLKISSGNQVNSWLPKMENINPKIRIDLWPKNGPIHMKHIYRKIVVKVFLLFIFTICTFSKVITWWL